jgi:hypothetical protein
MSNFTTNIDLFKGKCSKGTSVVNLYSPSNCPDVPFKNCTKVPFVLFVLR